MRDPRWWHLSPLGSVSGVAFTILSITPSLVPRPALYQGAVAGASFAFGYLLGVGLWRVLRRFTWPSPAPPLRRRLWFGYILAVAASTLALGSLAVHWQNQVRGFVEMPPESSAAFGAFVTGFVPVVLTLILIGKGVRAVVGWVRSRTNLPVAALVATVVIAALVVAPMAGALRIVNATYFDLNGTPNADAPEPDSRFRSAGPDSAISWEALGRHGANFVGGGPTAEEISALTHVPAVDPIRVYAGLESAPTPAARAALVVAELERTGAFERSVLVVATTTGSGWLEPQTVDAVEYLHGGDTAIASMQYSYKPSWVSFLFDPDAPIATANALFDAVHAAWSARNPGDRPQLIAYGLSLGAHGSQAVFDDVADIRARTDGALFVGSPNGSPLWRQLHAARDAGSPVWQPVLAGGAQVRWMSNPGDEHALPGPWHDPRVLYLQHATDAVTWLGPELFWRSPEWLRHDQRAPDVSPSMRWIPVVTGLQVLIDMLMGESVPARHGHNFGDVVTPGWRAVTGDADLDEAAVARIQTTIEGYAPTPPHTE